jgi:hypothetical protein
MREKFLYGQYISSLDPMRVGVRSYHAPTRLHPLIFDQQPLTLCSIIESRSYDQSDDPVSLPKNHYLPTHIQLGRPSHHPNPLGLVKPTQQGPFCFTPFIFSTCCLIPPACSLHPTFASFFHFFFFSCILNSLALFIISSACYYFYY